MNAPRSMLLIVGLGNPGPEYAGHRHNIGFMAIDAIARDHGASAPTKKFHGMLRECVVAGQKILLLAPATFMNLSGKSVQAAMAFYKIPPENVIVLHDELDLPLTKLRIKQAGGANGHNGIKDIDQMIGPDYWRVRLGIGHPGMKAQVHGYVLSNFSKDERAVVDTWMEYLARALPLFWQHSPQALMNKMAQMMAPPPPDKPAIDKHAAND